MTSGQDYTLGENPFKFFRNTALIDYLSTSCGININKPDVQRVVETYKLFAQNTLHDAYGSTWLKMNQGATNFANNMYRNILTFGAR